MWGRNIAYTMIITQIENDCIAINRIDLNWNEFNLIELNCIVLYWTEINWIEFNRCELKLIHLNCIALKGKAS